MRWRRLSRLLGAAVGEDGTAGMWERLSADGGEVIRLAYLEAGELGHPCLADEHVLLGLLRHDTGPAAALLHAAGLDLPSVRAELLRVGPTLGPRVDPAGALRSLGIEVDQVRRRLEATFGAQTVHAAERRVRRRPRWRGGHPGPSPLCVYLPAKRSLLLAAEFADRRSGFGRPSVQPTVASRRRLATVGWTEGRPNPLRLLLEARGIDLTRLAAELGGPF